MNLIEGRIYELIQEYDGHEVGTRVIFKWLTKDKKHNIFSPEGEPDMQSMFGFGVSETSNFIREIPR